MAKSAANSYLGPAAAASQAVESYLIPLEYDEIPEASQAVDTYLIPDELPSAQEEVIVTKALDSYFGPSVDRDAAPSQAEAYYALPLADVLQPQPSIAEQEEQVKQEEEEEHLVEEGGARKFSVNKTEVPKKSSFLSNPGSRRLK